MNSRIAEKLAPWVFTIAIFVIWEASCRLFRINTSVLQPPSAAFDERSWLMPRLLTLAPMAWHLKG